MVLPEIVLPYRGDEAQPMVLQTIRWVFLSVGADLSAAAKRPSFQLV
jgi:hypothetical protein